MLWCTAVEMRELNTAFIFAAFIHSTHSPWGLYRRGLQQVHGLTHSVVSKFSPFRRRGWLQAGWRVDFFFFPLDAKLVCGNFVARLVLPDLFSSQLRPLRKRLMTRACCTCSALHVQKHAETVECTVLCKVGKRLSLVRNPLQSFVTRLAHPHHVPIRT